MAHRDDRAASLYSSTWNTCRCPGCPRTLSHAQTRTHRHARAHRHHAHAHTDTDTDTNTDTNTQTHKHTHTHTHTHTQAQTHTSARQLCSAHPRSAPAMSATLAALCARPTRPAPENDLTSPDRQAISKCWKSCSTVQAASQIPGGSTAEPRHRTLAPQLAPPPSPQPDTRDCEPKSEDWRRQTPRRTDRYDRKVLDDHAVVFRVRKGHQ
jgi:hypothetical protein